MNDINEYLKEIRERLEAATSGPGFVGFCKVDETTRQKIIDAFISSLDLSVKHDPSNSYYFIETDDGLTVAIFGNGPTSKANANLWAAAHTDIPRLLKVVEVYEESLRLAKAQFEGLKLDFESHGQHISVPFHIGYCADNIHRLKQAQQKARDILGGEGLKHSKGASE